jgi:succinate-semialdehyde dehydrogenase/glutarate-semialdehyde dehydrogenase
VIPETQRGRKMLVLKEPIGIVAAITPWNFPMGMLARKAAPALAAGCTVVAKPAEDAPLSSLALAALAEEAGVPAGVLNVVTASRSRAAEVADAWLEDFRVRKVTFTGSTAVGKHLARECAATLKKASLELGGNAPFIVFADADLEAAAEGLMAAKFRNAGQTCICPNRVFVHASILDRFTRLLTSRVNALRVGPGSDEANDIGPLINERAVAKVEGAPCGRRLERRPGAGGRCTAAWQLLPAHGRSRGGSRDAALQRRDIRARRAAGDLRYRGRSGGARQCHAVRPGGLLLHAGRRAHLAGRRRPRSGLVGVNDFALSSEVAPFGGVKSSGYGREGSKYGLDEYLQTKFVLQGNLAAAETPVTASA